MRRAFPLLLLLGVLLGCGGGVETTTVTGKITYEGKPVTHGLINFRQPGGQPRGGGIEADGTYSLEAPAGEYQVRIDSPEQYPPGREGQPATAKPVKPREVPAEFASFETSGLTATVAGESEQQIDFNLP